MNKRYINSDDNKDGNAFHPDFQTSFKTTDADMIKEQIKKDISNNKSFLYMKGTPIQPQCGFSKTLITIFNFLEVEYNTRDVLSHPQLRQVLKEFSDWPTFPQFYYNGELVGGHDIVVDMFKSGELQDLMGIEDKGIDNESDDEK